jgi:hypothetical protein
MSRIGIDSNSETMEHLAIYKRYGSAQRLCETRQRIVSRPLALRLL